MKYITIATDISTDHRRKISTWACYIRHDGGAIKKSGMFKVNPKNTVQAETYALVNALIIASKNIPGWAQSKIVIHNEIEYVLDPVKTKAGNIRRRDEDRSRAILEIAIPILETAADWDRRKIKAHFRDWQSSDNPAKYAINRWCDKEANRLMKTIRNQKKKEAKVLAL